MAKKSLTERPTSTRDYAYTDYISFTREEFVRDYPLTSRSAVTTIGVLLAGLVPHVGWIVSVTDALCGLSSSKKTQMMNEIYTAIARFPQYSTIMISSKFVAYQNGSQGLFWMPGNDYMVLYS
nr:hypothetical protein [uncultured Aminipila sp.]